MAFEFKLPDIGEGVVEGEIVKWLVKEGDPVDVDQPMVEVMTDKATVVIPSPKKGVVKETRGKEGQLIQVHSVLVVIDEAASQGPKAKAEPAKAEPARAEPARAEAARVEPSRPVPPAREEPVRAEARSQNGGARAGGKVLAAPATRRLARELNVD